MAGAEFDEASHPRDDHGKFTAGKSAGALSKIAKAATKAAASLYARVRGSRPASDAPASDHAEHASNLKDAVKANVAAGQAHSEAADAHKDEGNADKAKEHESAADAHKDEARTVAGEAKEHEAIAKGEKPEGGEKKEPKEKPKGEGLASWVKEKLASAREGLKDKIGEAKEAEEQVLEGDVYRAGEAALKGTLGGAGNLLVTQATGGVARQIAGGAVQKYAKEREEKKRTEKEKKE